MIELHAVVSGYNRREILHNISYSFAPQKITAVIGPNGSGKTTLLKTICGIIPIRSGEILINQKGLNTYKPKERAKLVAYVPQSRTTPHISVYRLLLHGRFPYTRYPCVYQRQDHEIVKEILIQTGLTELADIPVHMLSGGQKQQVYLAMALVQQTPVILFDEPTTFLDIRNKLETEQRLQQLKQSGKTVITVLHDFDIAFTVADSIVMLSNGTVVTAGPSDILLQSQVVQDIFGVAIHTLHDADNKPHFMYTLK